MCDDQHGNSFYRAKSSLRAVDKTAVALWLLSHLREGDALLIDAGTSLTPVAQLIALLAREDPDRTHFTIVTHNYGAFGYLTVTAAKAHLNVFLTGGRYDDDLQALFGDQAQRAYADYCPKWVLIGQNGLDANIGLFCHGNTEELALKTQILEMPTDTRVVVSDWSKIGLMGGLCFGPVDKLGLNALQCIVLTTQPPTDTDEDKRSHFEAQCGLLDDIDGVRVERVDYDTEDTDEGIRVSVRGWSVLLHEDMRDEAGVARLTDLQLPDCP